MLRKIISFKGLDHKLSESKIRACANTCQKKLNVAVILSGCGVFDGTETHEAAATVTHLSRKNMQSLFYAPCMYQTDVVNHFTVWTGPEKHTLVN